MAGDNKVEKPSKNGIVKLRARNAKKDRKMMLEAFLVAMKEDLAEWLSSLMKTNIDPKDFMAIVENGVVVCQAANIIQTAAETYSRKTRRCAVKIPEKGVHFTTRGATSGSFVARDNVANFIAWCRALGIVEAIIFESEDLVLHKNEKRVILTLLDVARKANKFGVKPPEIVILEEEIDRELELDRKRELAGHIEKTLVLEKDNNLDDLVKEVVDQCSCHAKFPVKKLADGKYKVGKQKTLIFVRVMRNHVMVRVGGGWDTLTHYVEKHDPCRVQVAGQIDDSGKCGQKFNAEESPLRNKKNGSDHTWDDESICSTESSGSAETHSSGSFGDCCSNGRGHLRGNEVAPAQGRRSSNVMSSPRARRSTMATGKGIKRHEQQNGHSSNTQHWIQNHADAQNSTPGASSPRLRSKTWATRSPITPRKGTQTQNNIDNTKHSPRAPGQSKSGLQTEMSPYQPQSNQRQDQNKPSSIPVPISKGGHQLSGIPRPLFFKSKTMELCNGAHDTNRRRTATYSANRTKPADRLTMVGRREKSMDSLSTRQATRNPARKRTGSAVKDNHTRSTSLNSKIATMPSPARSRKLASNDYIRDCRTTDAGRNGMQPRSAVFTV